MLTICPRQFKPRAYREIRSSGHVYLVISLLVALLSTGDLRFVFFPDIRQMCEIPTRAAISCEINERKRVTRKTCNSSRFFHITWNVKTKSEFIAKARKIIIIFYLLILSFINLDVFHLNSAKLCRVQFPRIII